MEYSLRSLRIHMICAGIVLNVGWMSAQYLELTQGVSRAFGQTQCDFYGTCNTLWVIGGALFIIGLVIPSKPIPDWILLAAGAMIPWMLLELLVVLMTWDCQGWGFAVVG